MTVRYAMHKILLADRQLELTLERLCYRLLEEYGDFSDACMVALQPRGVAFAERLHGRLESLLSGTRILLGKLDTTFYRDDFRRKEHPLKPMETEMDFLVEDRRVLLVDDVLFSGRSVRAALTALQHYGRAEKIELCCLIDRRFNREVPVQSDYTGLTIDALNAEYVQVEWADEAGQDRVILYDSKPQR